MRIANIGCFFAAPRWCRHVDTELVDEDEAGGMLAWPRSGFHVHTAVWIPEDDRAATTMTDRSEKHDNLGLYPG